jgi:hypothetical protein
MTLLLILIAIAAACALLGLILWGFVTDVRHD